MLRTTVACFAAGVGGADAITVLPFDAALGLPDAFARRIARNTQAILLDESQPRPGDRPGRRLLVRRAAHRRARRAPPGTWFHRDRAGRRRSAPRCDGGLVAERLAATWAAPRRRPRAPPRADHRRQRVPATWTSSRVVREPAPPARPAAGCRAVRRYAEAFEALRDRSTRTWRRTGTRPRSSWPRSARPRRTRRGSPSRPTFPGRRHRAPSTPVGRPSRRRRRRRGVRRQRRAVACLCSSDALYAEHAAAVAAALTRGRRRRVSGWPGDRAATYAGVDGFVYAGCDALAVLAHDLDRSGGAAMIPDFADIGLDGPTCGGHRRAVAGGVRTQATGKDVGDRSGRRRRASRSSRSTPRPTSTGLDFLRHLPGHRAVPARAVPDDVRQPAVDDPPVRRLLHRRGVQRLLPAQPGRRAEGPVDRVRPGHPPRLRLRPPAGGRRRRHGRRGDRLDLRHARSCSTASRSTR